MQTACVLNALARQQPELQFTIQSCASTELLHQWITHPFKHQQRSTDLGMLMDRAVDVQTEASLAAYREIHVHWRRTRRQAGSGNTGASLLTLYNISHVLSKNLNHNVMS